MPSLMEDNSLNHTVVQPSKKSVLFVKLTDSAIKAIEEYIENQESSKPTIQFENSRGFLCVPQNGETKQFSFHLSNIANDGSFECEQQDGNGSLKSVGSIKMKMLIHANEDSYVNTKNKMTAVDQLQKQNCVKEINTAGSRSNQKANGQRKKPVDFVPVASETLSWLKKSLPGKPGLPKTNSAIMNEPIRERLIHILAVRPYKKPELQLMLNNEGISNVDKNRMVLDLVQVAVLKKNTYHLADRMWSKVQDKWKYYSPEVAALVQKKKQSYLQSSKSPPLNQPSSQPNNMNLPKDGLPDIYPSITKQRISHFNQKSYDAVTTHLSPKKKLLKLCSSSETEVKNINCRESTKRRRRRKRKSKHQRRDFTDKSSSPEDEIKSGNQSTTLQFSNKFIQNKSKSQNTLFVKASSPGDRLSNFQSVLTSSSNLEPKMEDANTVPFITNSVIKSNSLSTKVSSSGFILNSSRELLLKSNGLKCRSNAVHQVPSALKVDKTNDIAQTSVPVINGNSKFRMQCSNQKPFLEEIPMSRPDNRMLDVNQVLHSKAIPAVDSYSRSSLHYPIQGSNSEQCPLQNTNCEIKENSSVHPPVAPMPYNNTDQTVQVSSQILHSMASDMLCSNSSSQSQVPSQNGSATISFMPFSNSSNKMQSSSQNGSSTASRVLYNNSSSKMQDSSQNGPLTASRRLFSNTCIEMKDVSQNHPLTAPYMLFNNLDSEMQDSSQNRPSVACRRLFNTPSSKLQDTSRVSCSAESSMECDAASHEIHSSPATMQPVHPSDVCDFKKQYFKIVSYEQRSLYASHFNAEYLEYIELFHRLQYKCKELELLENLLKSCREGTEEYNRVKKTASEVCKTCVPELKDVQRRDFLHEKLYRIRELIIEYDMEQTETS